MADRLSRERRSWNMSHIRSKDTGIEVKVRKLLFSKGYRYRKNDSKLPESRTLFCQNIKQ